MKAFNSCYQFLILVMTIALVGCNPIASDVRESASSLLQPPGSFHFLSSSTAPSQITFSWSNSDRAVSYEVKYGTQSGEYIRKSSCLSSPCTISSLASEETYYISVIAVNGVGANFVDNELAVRLDSSNYSPIANAQIVSAAYNSSTNITLTGTDPESATLTYTVLTNPSHGTLTGTGATRVYTPTNNYYGADSFTFRVNDGVNDSEAKTISINVASPATFYLSTYGVDATAAVNNPAKPYATAQAAYDAANAYQLANSAPVILKVSAGTYAGIVLSADWNSNVKLEGDSVSTTFLGGINGNGVNGAYYANGVSTHVPNCMKVQGFSTPTGDDCYVVGTRGRHINIYGSKINVGNITSNHGLQNDFSNSDPEFMTRPSIILNSGLKANDITSNNPGWMILPGIIEIKSGATARDIYANSIGAIGMGGPSGDPINGGSVYIRGTVRNIEAKGKDNQIDGSGSGGVVRIYPGAVAGNINVSGGGFAFSGVLSQSTYNCTVGSPGSSSCSWSNVMGSGGSVTIEGTAGNIIADGGYIPLPSESYTSTIFGAGNGGTVTVSSGGVAGNISASASVTLNRNRNTSGAAGGVVDISGLAGNISVNGSGGNTIAAVLGDYYVCAFANTGCLDPMGSGAGGKVILRQGSVVGNIEANGGSLTPYFQDSTPDYSFYAGAGIDESTAMNGGTIEKYSAVTHGTISFTPGTDGNTTGSNGTIIQH